MAASKGVYEAAMVGRAGVRWRIFGWGYTIVNKQRMEMSFA